MSIWKPTYPVTLTPDTIPGGYQTAEIAYSAPSGQLYLPSITNGEVGVGTELYLIDPASQIVSLDVFPNTSDLGFTINGSTSITITTSNTPYIFVYTDGGGWTAITGPVGGSSSSTEYNLVASNSGSYASTTDSWFVGGRNSGWSSSNWDVVSEPIGGVIAIDAGNCAVPLPKNLSPGDRIKVCGNVFNSTASGTQTFSIAMTTYTCADLAGAGTQIPIQILESGTFTFNSNGTICFEMEHTVTSFLGGCTNFILLHLIDSLENGELTNFTYTINTVSYST